MWNARPTALRFGTSAQGTQFGITLFTTVGLVGIENGSGLLDRVVLLGRLSVVHSPAARRDVSVLQM
jgi:hypothetical protein